MNPSLVVIYLTLGSFSSSHVWMWELDYKESWVQKNWCFWTVVLEKTLESPLDSKAIQPVHPKGNQSWIFIGRTDAKAETPLATWCKEQTHWKRPWHRERLKVGREGDDRGWHGWMALPTQWTWVWVNSGIWWWTGRPGVLQSMGSQRVGHNWATTDWKFLPFDCLYLIPSPPTLVQGFLNFLLCFWGFGFTTIQTLLTPLPVPCVAPPSFRASPGFISMPLHLHAWIQKLNG